MKLVTSDLVAEVQGSIGDTTFQRARGGLIARRAPRSRGCMSSFREQRRMVFAHAVQRWQLLSPERRAGWGRAAENVQGYGIRGALHPSTGYGYFVAQWSIDYLCGGLGYLTPPPPGAVREVETVSLSASVSAGTLILAWAPTPLSATEFEVVSLTEYASAISNVGGQRWFTVFPIGPADLSPLDLISLAPTLTVLLQAGRAIGVRFSIYDAGLRRLSRPVHARTVVLA